MFLRVILLGLMFLGCGEAAAGTFEFSTAVVAGPPGGLTSPALTIVFRGDGETVDALIDLNFDPSRFDGIALTPRNGALCVLLSSGRVRVISPGSSQPLTTSPVRWCELRFDIAASATVGPYNLTPDAQTLECAGLSGPVFPCNTPSGVGVLRVGPTTPVASFDYAPPPASTIMLSEIDSEISADFIPGGYGASLQLDGCAVSGAGADNFSVPRVSPIPFAFASDVEGSGLLLLNCTRQADTVTAVLTCTETRNGAAPVEVQWNLSCSSLPPDTVFIEGFEN